MSIFGRREKDTECKPRPRLIHWTCRKCGGKWTRKMFADPDNPASPTQEDATAESFCDDCLNAMTLETVTR